MELKEIVNLRKLSEYFDDVLPDEKCIMCPFRCVCCGSSEMGCLAKQMLSSHEDTKDLYDLERDAIEN